MRAPQAACPRLTTRREASGSSFAGHEIAFVAFRLHSGPARLLENAVAATSRPRILIAFVSAAVLVAAWPSPAVAQRRAAVVRRAAPRVVVVQRPIVFRHSFGYPFHRRNIWWPHYRRPWGLFGNPYGYGYGYGYYGYGYGYPSDLTSAVRIQATPREAEVFVDGYSAGVVDDFDGVFQRLRVRPGGHEIAIYLDGYRAYRQNLYLHAGASHTIRHDLVPIAPGEAMEPPPAPAEASYGEPGRMPDRRANDQGTPPGPPAERAEPRGRFGTLSLRVQPADAEVLVDGQPWTPPADGTRLSIELSEGRHVIEVRKAGYAIYREDVLIRNNAALNINVALTGGQQESEPGTR